MAAQGQTIADRLNAAKHSLAGQGVAKAVCKATTEEMISPKKKHIDYLLQCTHEPNVSIPQLANLLVERTQTQSWVVVLKSLITMHHLMCYGNERFMQYLASSSNSFQPPAVLEKTGGYDMAAYTRRYAVYLNEKRVSYRSVAFDFCRMKRGKEASVVRSMTGDKLLKTLPSIQSQLDALLAFRCTASELNNNIINTVFMFLFRDLIRLFACYNDGIINLLEKYFEMNKKHCREGLDLYKRFLARMEDVGEFLKIAERIGVDKGDIPDLKCAPYSLLDALEQHLAQLEGKKAGSSATGSGVTVTGVIDETLKKQALAEEEAALERIKRIVNDQHDKTNPFLSSVPVSPAASNGSAPAASNGCTPAAANKSTNESILDLFSAPAPNIQHQQQQQTSTLPSADLLQLANNPFADMAATTGVGGVPPRPPNPAAPGIYSGMSPVVPGMYPGIAPTSPAMFGHGMPMHAGVVPYINVGQPVAFNGGQPAFNNGHIHHQHPLINGNSFASNNNGLGAHNGGHRTANNASLLTSGPVLGGPVLAPFANTDTIGGAMGGSVPPSTQPAAAAPSSKLISGDLDLSLQSLVQNLGISSGGGAGVMASSSPQKQNWSSGSAATGSTIQPAAGMTVQPNAGYCGLPAQQQQPSAMGATAQSTAAFDPFGNL